MAAESRNDVEDVVCITAGYIVEISPVVAETVCCVVDLASAVLDFASASPVTVVVASDSLVARASTLLVASTTSSLVVEIGSPLLVEAEWKALVVPTLAASPAVVVV